MTDTVRNRFATLAWRAGVTVDGETPTPKMGRRFWYTLYGDAVRHLAERYAPIADDQGSAVLASSSTTTSRKLTDAAIDAKPCTRR